ncbi:membrane protein [Saccharopolyspora subtropica]|uniref:Membrane protein n=1 Tax=Saccharopolyspora thermophila TaxID=89367 RepID=A0A917JKW4_9PSEU|nr:type II CAAX endopeptidase family protein [Saccharopolyspora subtropica]GGI73873.1 membrane protein [Saccharopolyspora subtropica]
MSTSQPLVPTEPPPTRTHRWGLGAFFFAQAVFVLVSVVLAAALSSPDALALVAMLVLPTVLAGAVAVLITLVRGNGPRLDFGLEWRWSDVTTGLAIGGIGLVTTTIATTLWVRWMGPQEGQSTVSSLLDGVQLPPALAVVIFLHVWLIAPLCEELIYRGLLWGAMERLRWSQLHVFVLSTAVFAIGHLEPERTALLLVVAIPIGVARMVTGRLTASVVAHQVNNFLPALGLLLISLGLMPS